MDILFYPRINDGVDSSGRCSLYCVITVNQERCVPFSTKIKIVAKNWLPKKKTTNDEFADTIRQELNRIENILRRIKIEFEEESKPITANSIKFQFQKIKSEQSQRKDKKTVSEPLLQDFFDAITEKKINKGAKHSTKRHDKYLAKLFIDFAKSKGFTKIKPSDIDLDLVEYFIDNFKLSANYLNQSVRLLIRALDAAVRKRAIKFNPIKEVELLTAKKATTEQGLEMHEIEKLQSAITHTKDEQNALDVFLFMCGTSIDFCDYQNLKNSEIETLGAKKMLRNKREKTDRYNAQTICYQNTIIKDVALRILEKYGSIEQMPRFKYSHLLNKEIQRIAKREGIELQLTTKRARKTFANISINYELHTDEQTAYQMGHSNTNQLKNYRRYTDKILDNLLK